MSEARPETPRFFPDAGELPGLDLRPLPPGAGPVRVLIEADAPLPDERRAAVDEAWERLRRKNPKLHDGPILSVESASAQTGRIVCRRSSYRHLAVASDLNLDVRLLGVRGVITGHVRSGDEVVLLGRRSSRVRVYAGQWEHAPTGGVQVPPAGASTLGEADLFRALAAEGIEELGLSFESTQPRAAALLSDDAARSLDLIVRIELPGTLNPALPCPMHEGRWEYVDAAWVPTAGLKEFDTYHADSISPPARAVFRWLGWV